MPPMPKTRSGPRHLKLAIITDGNNKLGMGHVYQSMTLAERLVAKMAGEAEVRFLTKSDDAVVSLLKGTGRIVSRYDDDDSIFESLRNEMPDRVIFDKLDVAPELARKISEELAVRLAILTNLTEANQYADVTVMAGMGSEFKNVRRTTADGQIQFWGPKYWLIRPEFFRYGVKRATSVKNITLIFGGADQANLSSLVAAEILKMDTPFAITIVLGAAFMSRPELDAAIGKYNSSRSAVTIVENLKDVAELMFRSDLVFVSPGLSFFEALSVGTPVICFHQNMSQQKAWDGLVTTYDKSQVFLVKELIETKSFIFPNSKFVRSMSIGSGIDEIVTEILL